MEFQLMGDAAILREIGNRLKHIRLQQNMTQAALSEESGVSRRTIQKTEEGEVSTLATLIALMRVLGLLDQFDLLIPEPTLSPLQLAKLKGKERKRASRGVKRTKRAPESKGTIPASRNSSMPVREPAQKWEWGE